MLMYFEKIDVAVECKTETNIFIPYRFRPVVDDEPEVIYFFNCLKSITNWERQASRPYVGKITIFFNLSASEPFSSLSFFFFSSIIYYIELFDITIPYLL